jgi:nicotinamidase/pyrazinamidase
MIQKLFWDVDTQYDFMKSDGKLYVPEAESIIPVLEEVTRFAREHQIPIWGSVDYHQPDDPEISDQPDFYNTFPPHCLQGTPGWEKIEATRPQDPLWIDSQPIPAERLKEMITAHPNEVFFRKQRFDVFTNPNVIPALEVIQPAEIYVYGVALDVCDYFAIEGFLKLGKYQVFLIEDATKPIHPEKAEELLRDWEKRGVTILQSGELK